jgi:hypothetical protein
MILVGRVFNPENPDCSWKMSHVQRLMVTNIYWNLEVINVQEIRPEVTDPLITKNFPMKYGGFDIAIDDAVPENEVWFMNEGQVRIKVTNLSVPVVVENESVRP